MGSNISSVVVVATLLSFPGVVSGEVAPEAQARTDTVYLTDGRIVKGEIIAETAELVTVKEPIGTSGYATSKYPKSSIERIERASAPSTQALPSPVDNAASDVSAFTYDNFTYDNMMEHFEEVFDMELSTPVDGETRYMGTAANDMTSLELIGDRDNLTSAALMTGFPTDNEAAVVENMAILILFTRNAFPDWSGCGEWVLGTMERLGSGTARSEKRTMGDKTIEVLLIKELGVVTISVRRR